MGGGLKKEYRSLGGIPVLLRSLLPFFSLPALMHTVITLPEGDVSYVETLLENLPEEHLGRREEITLITGGKERSASVRQGLDAFPETPEYVLIHDGARPWVTAELVSRVAETMYRYGACIPALPSADAMKEIDEEGVIRRHLSRRFTVGAQTPQGFRYREIVAAHRDAAGDGRSYIDDSEIYSRYIGAVRTVDGDPANVKITYPRDLAPEAAE
jgi:2-C-methyl-D-erythritol 4-phosphate cytidylyltransferase/2-C-methyl-D-erythritol 4-phosphate cytidylyltransferase/2-C-methyl-D-erythritol 2,4-cyclodiphosphate synthase